MKNKKSTSEKSTSIKTDVKKKLKSLQEQVNSQGEMINAMAMQISELVRERNADQMRNEKLLDATTGQANIDTICGIIRRIDEDVKELKGQHTNCQNINKTIDELGALCAAAMVAAGTKLHAHIGERLGTGETPEKAEAHKSRHDAKLHMNPKATPLIKTSQASVHSVNGQNTDTKGRSYAAVVAQSDMGTAAPKQCSPALNKKPVSHEGNTNSDLGDDGLGTFTTVTNRRRKAMLSQRQSGSTAVLIGGSNVHRISAAARNEFNINKRMFKGVTDISTEDVERHVSKAVLEAGNNNIDVVLHVGSDDLACHKSVDHVLEGLASNVQTSLKMKNVRDVYVCTVEERRDCGYDVHQNACSLNEQLSSLCSSYGAKFIDLRERLRKCPFAGINLTGFLYTTEGSHNASQLILSEVTGFLD